MHRAPTPVELAVHLQDCLQNIRTTLATAVPPHTTIGSIQLLHHHRLQQVYQVTLSDHPSVFVVMPPPPMARLLRSEQNMIKSEAVVVRWIREEASRKQHFREKANTPLGSASSEETAFCSSDSSALSTANLADNPAALLLQYLPSPIPRSPPVPLPSHLLPSSILEFNMVRPPPGTPISMLPTPLTLGERACVDYQAGRLVRQLSRLSPESGCFGPALSVLAPEPAAGRTPARSDSGAGGMTSWSVAFHSILESILRDGEDVAVALAYPTIRKQFRRLGHLLDTVRSPSLVVVDAVDDTNLLVQRLSVVVPAEDGERASCTHSRHGNGPCLNIPTALDGQQGDHSQYDGSFSSLSCNSIGSTSPSSARLGPGAGPATGITVTGLRDWSHCVFGDPLFASIFCENPSGPFLRGFDCEAEDGAGTNPESTSATRERKENRDVRLLLYQCYHAIVQIVKGFYRLGSDQTTRELAARRRLTEALASLEAITDEPNLKARHHRPSGELSPAKKPRPGSGDETSVRAAQSLVGSR